MTPLLIDTPSFKYKWKTRVYWVLNGIENWNDIRVKCIVCGKPFVGVDVKNVTHGYAKKTCCKKCERTLAYQSCIKYMQEKYGVGNAYQIKEVVDKLKLHKDEIQSHREKTRRKNKTFKVSKQEDAVYEMLCNKFGKDDIKRQYKSYEYPFLCDFYVKSLDLYIECNFSWTHGGHWFNKNSKEDLDKVAYMKSKHSKYYDNAIETWTIRDVKKRECAEKNGLNFIVFWHLPHLCELEKDMTLHLLQEHVHVMQ